MVEAAKKQDKAPLTAKEVEALQAQSEAWWQEARQALEAHGEAEAYDAWVRRKVQEALDSAQFLTAEEVEAEAAVWRAEVRRKLAAESRRMVDETGLGARSHS